MAHVYARPHHMLQTEEEVLDIVEDDPSTSTREIARQVKDRTIQFLNVGVGKTMVLSMDRWVGKVAVVTGASSGIGAAIAEQLVEEGLEVVALARRKERLDQLAKKLEGKKGKLYPIKTDVSKEEDILNAFKWIKENLGPVHVLVNNAGIVGNTNLSDGDSNVWRNIINVNVLGLSIATREAVRDMKANNVDGHIIHINSVVGHQLINAPNLNVYPATKYAVTALAETLRLELNSTKSKIKITSLSPGLVDTELIPDDYKQLDIFQKAFNDKAVLDPQDIADGVVYALSTPPHVQYFVVIIYVLRNTMVLSMDRWVGKAAVVTGASSGIGAAIAEQLVEEGLKVVGLARRKERLDQLAKKLEDGDSNVWRNIINVNVLGLSIATREAVRDMKANNVDGHIIHINSIVGHQLINAPDLNVYPATKYAVTALAETLRLELNSAKSKIKITSLSPGLVDTEIIREDIKNLEIVQKAYTEKAILDPRDIADGVIYALSTPPHVQIQELTIRTVIEFF
ncbi:hypothetical protein NQ317_015394 [Molorchus minor]|uniref:Farnesol dehydrogenase n=1 Tax=Molorchus minor TaxID=1323400 RepID=A0ABQ9IT93_9CUCU|nr:hypothetical protein NQ317_015394 [Molorchus minor]